MLIVLDVDWEGLNDELTLHVKVALIDAESVALDESVTEEDALDESKYVFDALSDCETDIVELELNVNEELVVKLHEEVNEAELLKDLDNESDVDTDEVKEVEVDIVAVVLRFFDKLGLTVQDIELLNVIEVLNEEDTVCDNDAV